VYTGAARLAGESSGQTGERVRRWLGFVTKQSLILFLGLNVAGFLVLLWVIAERPGSRFEAAPLLGPHLRSVYVEPEALPLPLCAPEIWEALERDWLSQPIQLRAGGMSRSYSRAELGARLLGPGEGLRELSGDIRVLALPLHCGSEALDAKMLLYEDSVRGVVQFFAAHVDRDAVDARWDFARARLIGGVQGRRLEVEAGLEAIAQGLRDGLVALELPVQTHFESPLDEEELGSHRPEQLLASYRTRFSRNRERVVNLRLAAGALDGIILMSGQSLSYNRRVGPRTAERGFQEAPVIEQGEIVEGMGGGACQISSTLHAAALFAGLDIVTRYNHSLPSSYIEKGLDATVSYPDLDLQIRNPYPFPVFVRIDMEEDQLRAQLWASGEGKRVKLRREVVEVIAFDDVVSVDPTLEPGVLRVTADGKVGYKVARARIIRGADGEQFERLSTDIYQSRSRKIRIAPMTVFDPQTLEPTILDVPSPYEVPPP
jgi:vancomycin resistance protein YoaR